MDERIVISGLDRNEALRYMGQADRNCDARLESIMEDCEAKLLAAVRPHYLYQSFDLVVEEDGVHLNGASLVLTGEDIKKHLAGCEKAVLMCATLSSEVDRIIRVAEHADMLSALALDCLASTAVEQLCDKVELKIRRDFPGYEMTWRYGVGYGDLPISLQREFLAVLNAEKKIGLNATGSFILTPRKSVTAVIGLSRQKLPRAKRGCAVCNLKGTCTYRQKGSHCDV
ncbi:MAG: hypothetical protein NC086_09085 [Alistipes sp.]|nr:hypothetical protein [Alistipes sp.]